jgi:hypothetical protein
MLLEKYQGIPAVYIISDEEHRSDYLLSLYTTKIYNTFQDMHFEA